MAPPKPDLTVVKLTPKKPKAPPKPPTRKRADWEAVERDYRTNKFTLRELEKMHGASAGQISRKAAQKQWTQDLRQVIKHATDHALLLENATETQQGAKNATNTTGATAETQHSALMKTVLVVAEMNKQVILSHRTDIHKLAGLTNRALGIFERYLTELEQPPKEGKHAPDPQGVLLSAQRAAQALSRLQAMERKAFSLDDEEDPASKGLGAGDQARTRLSTAARAARIAKILQSAGTDEPEADDVAAG